MKLPVSEIFESIQGEGPNTGLPTTFVRLAGCNMRCPGWPCDTVYAIDPKIIREDATKMSVEEIVEEVISLRPLKICLTGGEPLLHSGETLKSLVLSLIDKGYDVECFTNGSFPIPTWAMQTMRFVMDWKLPGSGESGTNLDTRTRNVAKLRASDAIKFVIKDKHDMECAIKVIDSLRLEFNCIAKMYFGAVWGELLEDTLADWILEAAIGRPNVRMNVQVHKYIWDAEARGV